jgi:hypothetical protein
MPLLLLLLLLLVLVLVPLQLAPPLLLRLLVVVVAVLMVLPLLALGLLLLPAPPAITTSTRMCSSCRLHTQRQVIHLSSSLVPASGLSQAQSQLSHCPSTAAGLLLPHAAHLLCSSELHYSCTAALLCCGSPRIPPHCCCCCWWWWWLCPRGPARASAVAMASTCFASTSPRPQQLLQPRSVPPSHLTSVSSS